MHVAFDEKIPKLLFLKEGALLQFGHASSEGHIGQSFKQTIQLQHLTGWQPIEEVLADEQTEMAEFRRFEVAIFWKLFSFEDSILHFVVDVDGFSSSGLEGYFVIDEQHFLVLFDDVLEQLVEHDHVDLYFYLAGVGVAEGLPVFEALEVVYVGLVELRVFEVQFGEEEVVFVDSLVVDLDVLEELDGSLGVGDGLLVVWQLLLANCEVDQRVHEAGVDDVVLADGHADPQNLLRLFIVFYLV
jgi:hypothetical protein